MFTLSYHINVKFNNESNNDIMEKITDDKHKN